MNHYLLGLGSNINPEKNLPRARAALADITDVITISPVVDGNQSDRSATQALATGSPS